MKLKLGNDGARDLRLASVQEIEEICREQLKMLRLQKELSQNGKAPKFVEDPARWGEMVVLGIHLQRSFKAKTTRTI